MDEDIARLVREERLIEAAELASARGDAGAASALFERACDWKRAAHEALRAGDAVRALTLGVEARDPVLAESAVARVVQDPASATRAATALAHRGAHAWAARLYEATGRTPDAARAWERAGDALRAASAYEAMGEPVNAARVLEAALRRDPSQWAAQVALGTLLLRFGKPEPAVRALQRVPAGAPERRPALAALVDALARLGLAQAAREADAELETLGGRPRESPPSAAPPEPPRPRLYGRYEVVREVASSPTARVLECFDVVRGERVALKAFAGYDVRGAGRDALARFEREVQVLAALDHPNIVPLRDYFAEGPSLVLRWMPGGTLESLVAGPPLAPARAVEIACGLLSALGEAHRVGVLHRDVKPANVLFDEAGTPRLADFGVAHLGDLSTTATAGVIGTLAYMSPEQRQGQPATARSDLYSVGVLLREMLTRERPAANAAPRVAPSAAHRGLDARHDQAVARLADPNPTARPADAFEARRALLALPWPATAEAPARPPTPREAEEPPAEDARLVVDADGRSFDRWVGRSVERIPWTEESLRRASAFARAGHDALQAVLRVDREAREIWLEALTGPPLDRPPTEDERRRLKDALTALHAAGIAHGAVDRAHVVLDARRGVVLRLTATGDPTWTGDIDYAALTRL